MKPSQRITELYNQVLPQIDAQARTQYDIQAGRPLTDAEWLAHLDNQAMRGPIAMTARFFALQEYLDEQHEPRRVICPDCKAAGQRSRCTVLHTEIQDIYIPSYYDEDGLWVGGGNTETEALRCSNGHNFHVAARKP